MLRLVLIVLIVVLLLSAFFLPRFRRALWITLGIVATLVVIIIWVDNRERELSHKSIPLAHVELQNMEVTPGLNARSYFVQGRVLNHSANESLRQVVFEVNLQDCQLEDCQIVAQERGRVSVDIPPSQARDFKVSVPFSSSIHLQGKPEWTFTVVDVNDR